MVRPYLTTLPRVESISIYPISGGPELRLQEATVYAGGIKGDRALVLGRLGTDGVSIERVGAKESPKLRTIRYQEGARVAVLDTVKVELPEDPFDLRQSHECTVQEFGDQTPVVHVDPELDEKFSQFLGMEVGLYRKTAAWRYGFGVPPRERDNAAVHVIGLSTVEDICNRAGIVADSGRFRPSIVVSGWEANAELGMSGGTLEIFGVNNRTLIQIDRLTQRCRVIGIDPETGEDRGDIPLLSLPQLLDADGKPKRYSGAYGHGVESSGVIAVGNMVNYTPPTLVSR